MLYKVLLVLKQGPSEGTALSEIKKYIEEKKGKILKTDELGRANLTSRRGIKDAQVFKMEVEIDPAEVAKVKKKISREEEVATFLLEKIRVMKFKEEKIGAKRELKAKKTAVKKKSQAKKVLTSMQEEEKKIKDLDSTLDKILNE